MIRYVKGDLLLAPQRVIVHGTNAQGVMGSGVAKQIRNKWPNVYEIYRLRHQTFGLALGEIIPVATTDGKIVVNAVTQEYYGNDGQVYVSYDALTTCFDLINSKVDSWDTTEVAMPRIGAGLGGGDWSRIEEIIVKSAKNYLPVIYDLV